MRRPRRARRRAAPFALLTARGRRSPALAWRVTTSAGEPHDLSGLQRAVLAAVTWNVGHGRHRLTLEELAELSGTPHRGSIWHVMRRLRSLNLVGYRAPIRGRLGHYMVWIPTARSARSAARHRAVRWPSRAGAPALTGGPANVVTLTPFGGFLSREGLKRGWLAAQTGHPPGSAGPPAGWAAVRPARSRGRSWPPARIDERCPLDGTRIRLPLIRQAGSRTGDVGAVYGGPCRQHRGALAVRVVLGVDVPVDRLGPATVGQVARHLVDPAGSRDAGPAMAPASPDPALVAAARAIVGDLEDRVGDPLRVRYLGWRRRADPPALDLAPVRLGRPDELVALVDAEAAEVAAELRALADARAIEPPATLAAGPTEGRT